MDELLRDQPSFYCARRENPKKMSEIPDECAIDPGRGELSSKSCALLKRTAYALRHGMSKRGRDSREENNHFETT